VSATDNSAGDREIEVRGGASVEEIAAVVAAISVRQTPRSEPGNYELWRRQRIAALYPRS
jgi:hypothetical protein